MQAAARDTFKRVMERVILIVILKEWQFGKLGLFVPKDYITLQRKFSPVVPNKAPEDKKTYLDLVLRSMLMFRDSKKKTLIFPFHKSHIFWTFWLKTFNFVRDLSLSQQ